MWALELLKTWGTLLVAVAALVQPWLAAAWRRFLRSGSVEIYETGMIEIGYSGFGATIGLYGTFRARDRDFFIRSARLELLKVKDQSRHRFEWGALRSAKVVVGRPQEATLELPAGFMLLTSQPNRYNILFYDAALLDEVRPVLEGLRRSWAQTLLSAVGSGGQNLGDPAALEQQFRQASVAAYPPFSQTPPHVTAYTELDRLCYWQPGDYQVTVSVHTAQPDREFKKNWHFALSGTDVQNLRPNALKTVQEACGQYYGQYNFSYVRYLERNQQAYRGPVV